MNIVFIIVYFVIAVLLSGIIYRRLKAEFPLTHRDNPEGTALFAGFLSVTWPIGFPTTILFCRRPERTR